MLQSAGLAAGAGAAIRLPPLLLVTAPAAIGAGVGAWMLEAQQA